MKKVVFFIFLLFMFNLFAKMFISKKIIENPQTIYLPYNMQNINYKVNIRVIKPKGQIFKYNISNKTINSFDIEVRNNKCKYVTGEILLFEIN